MSSATLPTRTQFDMCKQQTGASLIVSLMLLVVLTLLGLSGMQSTIMQERMSNNVRDKGMAFQAAESATRGGESWVQITPGNTLGDVSSGGTCSPPCLIVGLNDYVGMTAQPFSWWQTTGRDFNSIPSGAGNPLAANPHFIVEFHSRQRDSLDPNSILPDRFLYRLTSMGVGGTDTATAMIETLYAKIDN